MTKTYSIEVDCPHCAILCEEQANKTEGIKSATINFMTQKMSVEFTDNADEKKVLKQVIKNCRKIEPDFSIEF